MKILNVNTVLIVGFKIKNYITHVQGSKRPIYVHQPRFQLRNQDGYFKLDLDLRTVYNKFINFIDQINK